MLKTVFCFLYLTLSFSQDLIPEQIVSKLLKSIVKFNNDTVEHIIVIYSNEETRAELIANDVNGKALSVNEVDSITSYDILYFIDVNSEQIRAVKSLSSRVLTIGESKDVGNTTSLLLLLNEKKPQIFGNSKILQLESNFRVPFLRIITPIKN